MPDTCADSPNGLGALLAAGLAGALILENIADNDRIEDLEDQLDDGFEEQVEEAFFSRTPIISIRTSNTGTQSGQLESAMNQQQSVVLTAEQPYAVLEAIDSTFNDVFAVIDNPETYFGEVGNPDGQNYFARRDLKATFVVNGDPPNVTMTASSSIKAVLNGVVLADFTEPIQYGATVPVRWAPGWFIPRDPDIEEEQTEGVDYGIITRTVTQQVQKAAQEWVTDDVAATVVYGRIGSWNVALVTDFSNLFSAARVGVVSVANASILDGIATYSVASGWNTISATNMSDMFANQTAINPPIVNVLQTGLWNTSRVSSFARMFQGCTAFVQNISTWKLKQARADGEAQVTIDFIDMFTSSGLSVSVTPAFLQARESIKSSWQSQTQNNTFSFQEQLYGGLDM